MLIAVIGIVFLSGHFMVVWQRSTGAAGFGAEEEEAMRKEYEEFMASIVKAEKAGKWRHAEERRNAAYGRKEETPAALSAFNPNTADSATLRKLGLPGWMAKNILRYREKGGRFRKAEDFKKVYGMTEDRYAVLSTYIEIAPEDTVGNAPQLYIPPEVKVEIEKYAAGTVLNLNLADTTELKKIPGIGSGIARLIVGRRKMLGGFYRIEQLKEIHLNVDSLREWFSIHPQDIQRINVNRASVERLRAHPYINFYQAKAMVEYRRKKGNLKSLKPFALYEEFTEEDLERMGHYVCFE